MKSESELHILDFHLYLSSVRFKRRILRVPNLMQMRKIYCFRSFALDSAHVKCDVYNGPKVVALASLYLI